VAFSPDGKQIVSGHKNGIVNILDATTGTILQTLTGHEKGVTDVTFSPDGKRMISSSHDKTIKIWDVRK
jgi:WD40 repeat protein